jgi:hypothetical protein
LELFLKYQDKSIFSILEQEAQIYVVNLKSGDFSNKRDYALIVHYLLVLPHLGTVKLTF